MSDLRNRALAVIANSNFSKLYIGSFRQTTCTGMVALLLVTVVQVIVPYAYMQVHPRRMSWLLVR